MGKKKRGKRIVQPIDGLGEEDKKRILKALRQIWSWSVPRKLCIQRATHSDGFARCEKCKKKVPKVFPDHLVPVGQYDAGVIDRMFCPSKLLQAICKSCHQDKTNAENRARREAELARALGFH